jgi:adenosylcobinamide-GDP ribazoletransferase
MEEKPTHSAERALNPLQCWMLHFIIAGVFLTRLPFNPKKKLQTQDLAQSCRCFPLIGLLVGAISGAVFILTAIISLTPLTGAFLAIIAGALVTGSLHEDGLADVVDGFGGGNSKEDKLRIMRDSHIGVYGVLALVLSVGLRVSVLSGLSGPWVVVATLVGAAVLSRSFLPGMMYLTPRARTDGLAAGAGRPTLRNSIIAFFIGCVITWPLFGWWVTIAALVCALISTLILAFIAHRQIGGHTGDVLGATQQIAEIAILITVGALTQ